MKQFIIPLVLIMSMAAPTGCQLEDIMDMIPPSISGNVNENFAPSEESFDNNFAGSILGGDYGQGTVDKVIIGGFGGGIGVVPDEKIPEDEFVEENVMPEEENDAPSKSRVVTAIEYSKPIKAYTYSNDGKLVPIPDADGYGNHDIIVPEIIGAGAVNDKLYKNVSAMHKELLNNQEGINTYNANYVYGETQKAIAIIQEISKGEQMVGGYTSYVCTYYDLVNNKEIGFSEYLEILGFNKASLKEAISNVGSISKSDLNNIIGVALSTDATYVVIENPNAQDPDPTVGMYRLGESILK